MERMSIKDAIDCINDVLNSDISYDKTISYQLTSYDIEWLKMALDALSVQQEAMQNGICLKELISRDTAQKVEWEGGICAGFSGRICPRCKHTSYYLETRAEYAYKQPDNFCAKCGQRFVVEY